MLAYLVRRPGQLVTKEELVKGVWEGRALSDTVLSGTSSRLRKALGSDREELVSSVYGRGYRFVGAVRERASRAIRPASDIPFVGRGAALARVHKTVQLRALFFLVSLCLGPVGVHHNRRKSSLERADAAFLDVFWVGAREALRRGNLPGNGDFKESTARARPLDGVSFARAREPRRR
jgi:DNA-binding winged helix-turn-helix (wHTH) protein